MRSDESILDALFAPRSVAVVGASEDSSRIGGGLVLHFLKRHGFRGDLYPVNPKRDEVQGLRCYEALEAVPGPLDLAILSVPAGAVRGIIEALPHGHVRVALVVASGFGERDAAGRQEEEDLVALGQAKGAALVGPNSVGVVNLHHGLVATISQFFDREENPPGGIALVSQSGAFGTAVLAQAALEGLDFGYFLSSGNEADLEFSDFGHWLAGQAQVGVICAYIESIKAGQRFLDFADRARAAGKPVIALKVGTSEAGARAAKLHTGALAGSDRVASAVFDAHNIVRVENGEELIDSLKVFTRSPPSAGRRLAILSHSGGAGVVAADAAEAAGAELPPLPEDLAQALREKLPAFATYANPLDMTGGASLQGELMADCLRIVLAHDAYDAALLAVNLIWREGQILSDALQKLAAECPKPFAVSWVAPSPEMSQVLQRAPFPVFSEPARAARALTRRLAFDARHRTLANQEAPARPVARHDEQDLTSAAARRRLLEAYGIALSREALATSLDEAMNFFAEIGGPVVLKIASLDIAHRTEMGGVIAGVNDRPALEDAYGRILANARHHAPEARVEGVLIQEMLSGLEVLVGVKRDPVFGPILVLGAGGTLVELLDEVALRRAPVSKSQVSQMIASTRLARLLEGYRGGPPLDLDALVDLAERAAWLVADTPEIAELDLNPVVVGPEGEGCVAVDYKLVLGSSEISA